MTVIAVTGTDGKTTTCNLIYEILKAAGYKTGLISTVNAKIGEEEIDTGLHTTNPDAKEMQGLFRKMVEAGCTHAVVEVTSHRLAQKKTVGYNVTIAVLTNVTHEHLDYHGTMERYLKAKASLFYGAKYAVLNKDDASFEWLKARCKGKVVPYGKTKIKDVSSALAGDYNKYNIAAAEAVAGILKIDKRLSDQVIKNFAGVPGRREEVNAGQNFKVFVDFAHTPNALKVVLTQLRKELPKGNKLIAVFGATGERDLEKRPIMGKVATEIADMVIITSDDTRSESQDEIYRQIMSGINVQDCEQRIKKENDRRKAIGMAVGMARPGDIILLAGKGHEKSILLGKTEYPWSDAEEARKAIKVFA